MGWNIKKIDEIFELKNGYTPSKRNNDFWENGTVPWFTLNDIRTNGRLLDDSIQHGNRRWCKGW
jgi:type I restriction enzyme S subunit